MTQELIPDRPAGGQMIDIHFHADARMAGGGDLPKVDTWMKENAVSQLIVMQHSSTLPRNDDEARLIVENFKAYEGQIYRFCVLMPEDVADQKSAVKVLTAEKASGAIGFGEHYGKELFFDDPKCMQIYSACAEVGLPVLNHLDGGNNKDDEDLSHLENALRTYPECSFIGHGPGFWRKMKAVDTLLGNYDNLYADISAGSGARGIGRDISFSRQFMARHSEKVLFGTDGGPWSFGKEPPVQFELLNKLDLTSGIRERLCRKNAKKLFNLE